MKLPKPLHNVLFFATAVFAGWVSAFAQSPVSFWPCMFVGISALYWLWSQTKGMKGAWGIGFFFALGYFVTGLWWIGNALLVEGNEFKWVWPISVIGLPTLLALFTGTYLSIARIAAPPESFKGFLAFAFFLTFSEWSRGHAFTGFPWNLYGYVWADHLAMAQSTHYIGAYGLTFVSVLWCAMGGFLIFSQLAPKIKIGLAALVVATMAVTYAGGNYRIYHTPQTYNKDVGIVVAQPNIPQNMKWDPVAVQANFLKITSLSKDAFFADPKPKTIVIVWPETAISPAIYNKPENMDRIRAILSDYDAETFLATGVLRRFANEKGETVFSNSMIVLNERLSSIDVYDKYHLVPYGEFVPFQKYIPLKPVVAFKGFQPGIGVETITHPALPPFSPLICYEVIFADEVVKRGEDGPLWMVNVTNDGWYGKSAGPYQHFAQTRLRAIEEGIPIVRAANTGISAVIDPLGRVVEKADIFEEAAITTYLPEPIPQRSAYIRYLFQIFLPVLALAFMARIALRMRY